MQTIKKRSSRDAFGRFRKAKTSKSRKEKGKGKDKEMRKGKGKEINTKKHVRSSTSIPIQYGHIFSPACGHCQNMSQDWNELKQEIDKKHHIKSHDIGEDHQTKVDSFNREYHTDLKFDGFPTIFKLCKKNEPVQYYDTYYHKTNKSHPYRSKQSFQLWLNST